MFKRVIWWALAFIAGVAFAIAMMYVMASY